MSFKMKHAPFPPTFFETQHFHVDKQTSINSIWWYVGVTALSTASHATKYLLATLMSFSSFEQDPGSPDSAEGHGCEKWKTQRVRFPRTAINLITSIKHGVCWNCWVFMGTPCRGYLMEDEIVMLHSFLRRFSSVWVILGRPNWIPPVTWSSCPFCLSPPALSTFNRQFQEWTCVTGSASQRAGAFSCIFHVAMQNSSQYADNNVSLGFYGRGESVPPFPKEIFFRGE